MHRIRLIPILLLSEKGLVKTRQFKNPVYIGDPINAIRIFNEKRVDEIIVLDIQASKKGREPRYEMIAQLASECFMPMTYGGGIKSVEQASKIINCGVEKISLNAGAIENPSLISNLSDKFGNQSVILSADVKKNIFGSYKLINHTGKGRDTNPVSWAKTAEDLGAGEILLTSIDNEGSMSGYDLQLIKMMSHSLSIPLIANGGAGSINDFYNAIALGGASAVAAGSFFVYKSSMRGVLINYPSYQTLKNDFYKKLD